uniref:G_PROTEIN_RECEP_F1_2 domain-containing protein n=1 Tax=Steinernema glaseri TaxID=37863 RepID=A0A1I7YA18_9BILA
MFHISEEMGFILYIIEGSVIVSINLAVIFVVFCPHLLRDRKALVLLGGLCASDTVNAAAYLMAGISRLIVLRSGQGGQELSRYDCFVQPHNIMFYYGYQLTSIMTMVVSFDRVLAVFFPVKHIWFTMGRFNTYFILLGAFALCSLSFGGAFLIQSNDRQVFINIYCYFIFTLQRDVWDFVLLFRVVTISASVIVYLPICWRVRLLVKKSNQPKKLVKITTTIGEELFFGYPNFRSIPLLDIFGIF